MTNQQAPTVDPLVSLSKVELLGFNQKDLLHKIKRDQRLQRLLCTLRYLKTHQRMSDIEEQCQSNRGTQGLGVLSIIIKVDLMHLAEMDSDLVNLITIQPLDGTFLFREVVYELLLTKGVLPASFDICQLDVRLRICDSTLPDYSWVCCQQGRYGGLTKLRGIILGVTNTATYTKSTGYTCGDETCEGHHSGRYFRIHIPGASEQETVGQSFRCFVCGAKLIEDKSQRTLSEKLLAEVAQLNDASSDLLSHNGQLQQTVPVIIRDEFCTEVHLGIQYDIIGTQRYIRDGDSFVKMFEVNNLVQCQTKWNSSLGNLLTSPIEHLSTSWNHAPFVFPNTMAFMFADEVLPRYSFFKLKLMLLVSLTLTPEGPWYNVQDPPLHILAVGSETTLLGRLLDFAASLAPRSVSHTSLQALGAKTTASHCPWASYFVQAGSLVLAAGGICKIVNLKTLKKAIKQELQTVLTERSLQVGLEARYTGNQSSVLSLPLLCQVWAVAASCSADHQGFAPYGAVDPDPTTPSALLDAFGIVCYCDVSLATTTDVCEDLAEHILVSFMTAEDTTTTTGARGALAHKLTHHDFKQYLQQARSLKSVMSVEAEWLLTSYLMAARQARSQTSLAGLGTSVPLTAWNALRALSHGLCRLSLRTTVLEADAAMAIALYEETLTARHGVSQLNVFPEPHLPAAYAELYITTQLEAEMNKFHSRLLSLCSFRSGKGPEAEE